MEQTIREQMRGNELDAKQKELNKTKFDYHSVSVERKEGKTIIIPQEMAPEDLVLWTDRWVKQENKRVKINETMIGMPLDASRALMQAVKYEFGFADLVRTPGTFFVEGQEPTFMAVPVDYAGKMEDVYIGRMMLPGFDDGYIQTYPNGNTRLIVQGEVRQKHLKLVKQLIATARRFLADDSLYKGKAVQINFQEFVDGENLVMPKFMDISKTMQLILSPETEALVDAAIWTPIRHSERLRREGIPMKRAALLEGDFGTGKTLCAYMTAQIAVQYGWTYVYLHDVKQLAQAFEWVAANYGPAVVFAEDFDLALEGNVNLLQNAMDGVLSKNLEVILVLTTNYIQKMPSSLLRPGRFDSVISFSKPDAATAARVVQLYASEVLGHDADLEKIGEAVKGQIPAVIREIVDRAKLYAISRAPEKSIRLSTEDVVLAAAGMKNHLDLLQRGAEKKQTPLELFGSALGHSTGSAIGANLADVLRVATVDTIRGFRQQQSINGEEKQQSR